MADLQRDWVRYCALGGAALVLVFGWFMMTAEKPWRAQDRALAAGKWLDVDVPGRNATHRVTYEYEAKGRSYRGEYRCQGCMSGMARPARGESMSVEYRVDDPGVSRPAGFVSEGRARYHRVGLGIGVALLLAAGAGLFLGPARRRGE